MLSFQGRGVVESPLVMAWRIHAYEETMCILLYLKEQSWSQNM
jgi:hypothetical protein